MNLAKLSNNSSNERILRGSKHTLTPPTYVHGSRLKTPNYQDLRPCGGIRRWHKVTHVETRHRAVDIDAAEHMLMQRQLCWIGHVICMPSNRLTRRLLYGELLNGQRMPGGPKLRYMDHIRRILNKSNVPISDLEKLATDRDTWRSACASGLSTLCQMSDQAAADRRSRRHPAAQPNGNWSQMSAVQPSVCFRVWPAQPPS